MFTFGVIADKLRGRAGATWGVYVSMYVEVHRSGNMSVNHITYIVVYTQLGYRKYVLFTIRG